MNRYKRKFEEMWTFDVPEELINENIQNLKKKRMPDFIGYINTGNEIIFIGKRECFVINKYDKYKNILLGNFFSMIK